MSAPEVAVTPIMKALVAAATRMGTPQSVASTGTLMMPPPRPSSVETLPAMKENVSATGSRITR